MAMLGSLKPTKRKGLNMARIITVNAGRKTWHGQQVTRRLELWTTDAYGLDLIQVTDAGRGYVQDVRDLAIIPDDMPTGSALAIIAEALTGYGKAGETILSRVCQMLHDTDARPAQRLGYTVAGFGGY